jgi:hypothetical protein
MTRTLARRLATVGGALGIAVLACAGTASADASDPHAASHDVLATNVGNPALVAGLPRGDEWGNCPCEPPPPPPCRPCEPHDGGWYGYGHHDHDDWGHHGLLSDALEDLL